MTCRQTYIVYRHGYMKKYRPKSNVKLSYGTIGHINKGWKSQNKQNKIK
uniref:Uncharacterized protein n=1 Tax=Lepeophtheirus salmonis TaxID=72036 RepID=A0A0K2U006_LEPSM